MNWHDIEWTIATMKFNSKSNRISIRHNLILSNTIECRAQSIVQFSICTYKSMEESFSHHYKMKSIDSFHSFYNNYVQSICMYYFNFKSKWTIRYDTKSYNVIIICQFSAIRSNHLNCNLLLPISLEADRTAYILWLDQPLYITSQSYRAYILFHPPLRSMAFRHHQRKTNKETKRQR